MTHAASSSLYPVLSPKCYQEWTEKERFPRNECPISKPPFFSRDVSYDQLLAEGKFAQILNDDCLPIENTNDSLPYLEKNDLITLVSFLTDPITIQPIKTPLPAFTFTIVELISYLEQKEKESGKIHHVKIVGSLVFYLLKDYFKRCAVSMGVSSQFMKALNQVPSDADIRLYVPNATEEDLLRLKDRVKDFLAFKLHQQIKGGRFKQLKETIHKECLLNNFTQYGEGNFFSVISFGSIFAWDLLFVKELKREYLFTQDSLHLDISPLLQALQGYESNGKLLIDAIKNNKCTIKIAPEGKCGGKQAIIDRLAKIIRTEDPESINEDGPFLLSSAISKGKRLLQPTLEPILWKTFSQSVIEGSSKELAAWIYPKEWGEWLEPFKKKDLIDRIKEALVQRVNKAIKNHFTHKPFGIFALTFNLCLSLNKYHPDWVAPLWNAISPQFRNLEHPVVSCVCELMECRIPFEDISALLAAKAFLSLTAPQSLPAQMKLIMNNQSPAIQINIKGGYLLLPFQPEKDFKQIDGKEHLSKYPCLFRTEQHYGQSVPSSISKNLSALNIDWNELELIGERLISSTQTRIKLFGIELILACQQFTKNPDAFALLNDQYPLLLRDKKLAESAAALATDKHLARAIEFWKCQYNLNINFEQNWIRSLAKSRSEKLIGKSFKRWKNLKSSYTFGLIFSNDLLPSRPDLALIVLEDARKKGATLQSCWPIWMSIAKTCMERASIMQDYDVPALIRSLHMFFAPYQTEPIGSASLDLIEVLKWMCKSSAKRGRKEDFLFTLRVAVKENFSAEAYHGLSEFWLEVFEYFLTPPTQSDEYSKFVWEEMQKTGMYILASQLTRFKQLLIQYMDRNGVDESLLNLLKGKGKWLDALRKKADAIQIKNFKANPNCLAKSDQRQAVETLLKFDREMCQDPTFLKKGRQLFFDLASGNREQIELAYRVLNHAPFSSQLKIHDVVAMRLYFLEKAFHHKECFKEAETKEFQALLDQIVEVECARIPCAFYVLDTFQNNPPPKDSPLDINIRKNLPHLALALMKAGFHEETHRIFQQFSLPETNRLAWLMDDPDFLEIKEGIVPLCSSILQNSPSQEELLFILKLLVKVEEKDQQIWLQVFEAIAGQSDRLILVKEGWEILIQGKLIDKTSKECRQAWMFCLLEFDKHGCPELVEAFTHIEDLLEVFEGYSLQEEAIKILLNHVENLVQRESANLKKVQTACKILKRLEKSSMLRKFHLKLIKILAADNNVLKIKASCERLQGILKEAGQSVETDEALCSLLTCVKNSSLEVKEACGNEFQILLDVVREKCDLKTLILPLLDVLGDPAPHWLLKAGISLGASFLRTAHATDKELISSHFGQILMQGVREGIVEILENPAFFSEEIFALLNEQDLLRFIDYYIQAKFQELQLKGGDSTKLRRFIRENISLISKDINVLNSSIHVNLALLAELDLSQADQEFNDLLNSLQFQCKNSHANGWRITYLMNLIDQRSEESALKELTISILEKGIDGLLESPETPKKPLCKLLDRYIFMPFSPIEETLSKRHCIDIHKKLKTIQASGWLSKDSIRLKSYLIHAGLTEVKIYNHDLGKYFCRSLEKSLSKSSNLLPMANLIGSSPLVRSIPTLMQSSYELLLRSLKEKNISSDQESQILKLLAESFLNTGRQPKISGYLSSLIISAFIHFDRSIKDEQATERLSTAYNYLSKFLLTHAFGKRHFQYLNCVKLLMEKIESFPFLYEEMALKVYGLIFLCDSTYPPHEKEKNGKVELLNNWMKQLIKGNPPLGVAHVLEVISRANTDKRHDCYKSVSSGFPFLRREMRQHFLKLTKEHLDLHRQTFALNFSWLVSCFEEELRTPQSSVSELFLNKTLELLQILFSNGERDLALNVIKGLDLSNFHPSHFKSFQTEFKKIFESDFRYPATKADAWRWIKLGIESGLWKIMEDEYQEMVFATARDYVSADDMGEDDSLGWLVSQIRNPRFLMQLNELTKELSYTKISSLIEIKEYEQAAFLIKSVIPNMPDQQRMYLRARLLGKMIEDCLYDQAFKQLLDLIKEEPCEEAIIQVRQIIFKLIHKIIKEIREATDKDKKIGYFCLLKNFMSWSFFRPLMNHFPEEEIIFQRAFLEITSELEQHFERDGQEKNEGFSLGETCAKALDFEEKKSLKVIELLNFLSNVPDDFRKSICNPVWNIFNAFMNGRHEWIGTPDEVADCCLLIFHYFPYFELEERIYLFNRFDKIYSLFACDPQKKLSCIKILFNVIADIYSQSQNKPKFLEKFRKDAIKRREEVQAFLEENPLQIDLIEKKMKWEIAHDIDLKWTLALACSEIPEDSVHAVILLETMTHPNITYYQAQECAKVLECVLESVQKDHPHFEEIIKRACKIVSTLRMHFFPHVTLQPLSRKLSEFGFEETLIEAISCSAICLENDPANEQEFNFFILLCRKVFEEHFDSLAVYIVEQLDKMDRSDRLRNSQKMEQLWTYVLEKILFKFMPPSQAAKEKHRNEYLFSVLLFALDQVPEVVSEKLLQYALSMLEKQFFNTRSTSFINMFYALFKKNDEYILTGSKFSGGMQERAIFDLDPTEYLQSIVESPVANAISVNKPVVNSLKVELFCDLITKVGAQSKEFLDLMGKRTIKILHMNLATTFIPFLCQIVNGEEDLEEEDALRLLEISHFFPIPMYCKDLQKIYQEVNGKFFDYILNKGLINPHTTNCAQYFFFHRLNDLIKNIPLEKQKRAFFLLIRRLARGTAKHQILYALLLMGKFAPKVLQEDPDLYLKCFQLLINCIKIQGSNFNRPYLYFDEMIEFLGLRDQNNPLTSVQKTKKWKSITATVCEELYQAIQAPQLSSAACVQDEPSQSFVKSYDFLRLFFINNGFHLIEIKYFSKISELMEIVTTDIKDYEKFKKEAEHIYILITQEPFGYALSKEAHIQRLSCLNKWLELLVAKKVSLTCQIAKEVLSKSGKLYDGYPNLLRKAKKLVK